MASRTAASTVEALHNEEESVEQDLHCIREKLYDIDMLIAVVKETQQHSRFEDCAQYQELLQERLVDIASKLENMASISVCASSNHNKFSSIMQKLQARAMPKATRGKKRKTSVTPSNPITTMPSSSTPVQHPPKPIVCARCRKNHKSAQFCRVQQKHTAPAWNAVLVTGDTAVAHAENRSTETSAAVAGTAVAFPASVAKAITPRVCTITDVPLATRTDHGAGEPPAAQPISTTATGVTRVMRRWI